MHRYRSLAPIALLLLGSVSTGCLEQYDPSRYKAQEKREWQQSTKPLAKLTETGEVPEAGAVAAVPIDVTYKQLCSSCHGEAGDGNGPAGAALTPHPRNFHDAAWQASATDDRIFSVIKNGGASVGLSPMMAPWSAVLTDDQIKEMVAFVRKFGQK